MAAKGRKRWSSEEAISAHKSSQNEPSSASPDCKTSIAGSTPAAASNFSPANGLGLRRVLFRVAWNADVGADTRHTNGARQTLNRPGFVGGSVSW